LLYFPRARATVVVPEAAVDALRRAQTFAAPEAMPSEIRRILRGLEEAGLVVGLRQLLDPAPEVPTPIATVGILTCDRPASLRVAATSYLASFARFGRRPSLVCLDDTRDPRAQEATRSAIADLPVRYVGAREKEQLAAALVRRSGVEDELVRFALFGEAGYESIGANRNALTLSSAGTIVLGVDDDTEARAGGVGDARHLVLADERDPTDFEFLPSRDAALARLLPEPVDVVGAYEALLGRRVAALAAEHEQRGQLSLGDVCDHLFDAWVEGSARVRVCFAGVLGDSGMYSGMGLRYLRGASRTRLLASEEAYRLATTSREVLRVAQRKVVTHGPPYMSTTMGLDARALVPPFLPILRNEDGVFGFTARACLTSAFFGHVPIAVLHAAKPGRRYASAVEPLLEPRFSDLLVSLLASASVVGENDRERMESLGRFLVSLGRGSARAFEEKLQVTRLTQASSMMEKAERALAMGGPRYWVEDLVAQLDALRRSIETQSFWLAHDLRGGPEAVQGLVHRFGRLLEAWPAIFDAARGA